MAKLSIIAGPQEGLNFTLGPDVTSYIIGRNYDNPIVLVDMNASRQHAQLILDGTDYYCEDMGSSNGTFVNGVRIMTRVKLKHNDQIKIGATVFKFEQGETVFTASPFAPGPAPTAGADDMDFGQSFVQMLDDKSQSESMDLVLDDEEPVKQGEKAGEDYELYLNTLKKLKTMYKVSEDIGTILDLNEVLEKIMDAIFEVFPQVFRGFIMLEDPQEGLKPSVIRKRGAKDDEQVKVTVSRTIVETAFREKKSILSSDAMDDDRFSEGLSIVNFEIRSMMCTPLFVGDEKLGVIHIDTQDQGKRFTPDDLSMLQGIGRQAAVSIKNAKLVDDIEEETKRRNSLQRFLSPDLADQVMTGELDLKLGGDEKYGTVFFSDIIGFTRMSSVLEPEVVVAKINRYFNVMINIIFNYSGTINKFWGDAIMALWGLMSKRDDYSPQVSAVEACLDMQNALFDFNYSLIEEGQKPIWMGIGLNTGNFLAGNVGSEQQMEYTVIGDNVNLASRIESKAARGQIYISDTTFERVKDRVYSIKMDPTKVKGKEEAIQIYSIRGFRDREFNSSSLDRITIPAFCVDSDGEQQNGLIIGVTGESDTIFLYAHFKHVFPQDMDIELQIDLPEIKEPGRLKCKIQGADMISPEENVKFYNYTLKVLEKSEFFTTFLQGKHVEATIHIDNIDRGSGT